MNLRFCFLFFIVLIHSHASFSQEHIEQLSLKQLDDTIKKTTNPKPFIYVLEKKAKKKQDTFYMAKALFCKALYLTPAKDQIPYGDSIINLTSNFDNYIYPGAGHSIKAYGLINNGRDDEALLEYLKAYDHAIKYNNFFAITYAKANIGNIYNNFGQYEKSLKTLKELRDEIEAYPNGTTEYATQYLYTLRSIANAYIRGKQMNTTIDSAMDSAIVYIKKALPLSRQLKDTIEYNALRHQYANYLQYEKKNYLVALDSFKSLAPDIIDKQNLAMIYNAQSEIYDLLNQKEHSIIYLKKVDSMYLENKIPFEEHVGVYKKLYDYYYEKGDRNKQLYAINKLFEADSISSKIRNTANTNPLSELDLLKLKEEKEKLLEELNKEHNKTNYIIVISVIVLIILITILIKLNLDKKQLKTKFDNIVKNQDAIVAKTEVTKETIQEPLNISKDVIDSILDALTHFENNKDYLNNQTTLASLAKQLNTNSVYLSKIINYYKGVSLSNYLTNLRIDYCISELRHNATLRKYTIKAIAQEMGFRNSESFSKAFKKQTGLNPSYYIKELNKLEEKVA